MWMWAEACELLDRAERLQRQFFRPGSAAARAAWEPPVDVFETAAALWIVVALPGVGAEQIEVRFDGSSIVVAGERRLPVQGRAAVLYRLEIPHGRFERRIELPPGRFRVGNRDLVNGCLVLSLEKLG
jgi:HSP20 family molecular chaperone IbpA